MAGLVVAVGRAARLLGCAVSDCCCRGCRIGTGRTAAQGHAAGARASCARRHGGRAGRGKRRACHEHSDRQPERGERVTRPCITKETADQVAALWDREAEGLTRYTTVITNSAAEAGDLVSNAFEAVALAWTTVGPRNADAQRAWLRRTCKNMWIDGIRRSETLHRLQPELAHRYQPAEPDPADLVLLRQAADHCLRVINSLPAVQRRVAVLYFLEEHPPLVIAILLEIAPSGVRKHVAKARQRLREELGSFIGDRHEPPEEASA
ncbi:RNA polymerase sigma factor [Streptomyces sp. NPDC057909]|uniref:RNA polymerase sigma factor n=1 Tax=Streptomyces sp. NPDC057909 TaxID=3346277 RepID=UPI0036ED4D2F